MPTAFDYPIFFSQFYLTTKDFISNYRFYFIQSINRNNNALYNRASQFTQDLCFLLFESKQYKTAYHCQ